MKQFLTAATLAVMLAAPAMAASEANKPIDPAELPAAMKSPQLAGSMEVVKSFPGPSGLTGWVVKDVGSGRQVVMFSTADKNTLMAGILMDKDGNNLSAAYGEQHIPKPDFTAVLKDLKENGNIVVEGNAKAKAEITVFYDVNCGFCKMLHKIVKPAVDAGDLRVRYLPVAILGADSAPKAAAVLASKNVAKTMDLAANGVAEKADDKELLAKVSANTNLMKKHGFTGTPAVLYQVKKGEDTTTVASSGLPTISEMYKQLGISEKHLDEVKKDAQLARFVR